MKVIKRNGKTDDFQVVKVKKAIEKAYPDKRKIAAWGLKLD